MGKSGSQLFLCHSHPDILQDLIKSSGCNITGNAEILKFFRRLDGPQLFNHIERRHHLRLYSLLDGSPGTERQMVFFKSDRPDLQFLCTFRKCFSHGITGSSPIYDLILRTFVSSLLRISWICDKELLSFCNKKIGILSGVAADTADVGRLCHIKCVQPLFFHVSSQLFQSVHAICPSFHLFSFAINILFLSMQIHMVSFLIDTVKRNKTDISKEIFHTFFCPLKQGFHIFFIHRNLQGFLLF